MGCTSQSAQSVTEFAGNASLRSFDSSDPLCPLQLDAHADWNADTGATSHMTPHRHWLRNYVPKRVAIKVADNNIVYSTGVGTVVFMFEAVNHSLSSQSVALYISYSKNSVQYLEFTVSCTKSNKR